MASMASEMVPSIRRDEQGVASTVATLFTLLVIVIFLQAALVGTIPAKQYEAERITNLQALSAFDRLRSMSSSVAVEGGQFTIMVPLGTAPVSPFAGPTHGTLRFDPDPVATGDVSFGFVPRLFDARIGKIDQDVVLAIDSSGSMIWNDPTNLRIAGAKDYVTHLECPDRIAIVDFDSEAHLTRENVGGPIHHLFSPGHNCIPDYSSVNGDLDTIDSAGSTNYGMALYVAVDELVFHGDPSHAWAVILLTDGENTACVPTPPCSSNSGAASDALALQQAQRARENGITIFTIGLGPDIDPALLTQIAETTGGTYYAAPTADSIRFIYFEIAMHFKGSITCGTLRAGTPIGGSVSLSMANVRYPAQTVRMESNGIVVSQATGTVVHQGMPVRLEPSGLGTGTIHLTVLTFVGPAFSTTGSQYQFLMGRFLGASVDDTIITRPHLGNQSNEVGNVSAFLDFWGNQEGFASPGAVANVTAQLNAAQARLNWGQANLTVGNPTLAKFNTDGATSHLSAAALQAQIEANNNYMEDSLANAAANDIFRIACQLDQWLNWYDGVSFDINTPNAAAWMVWFNETFRSAGVPLSYSIAGNQVTFTFGAIDRFVVDERVIELTFR